MLWTVIPVSVMTAVLPMFHAPPLESTVRVSVFPTNAPVIRALPDMKASGTPETGALVKVIARVFPGLIIPAVELNATTKFWQDMLLQAGIVAEVTWYPEIGPLGAPTLTASKLV